MVRNWNRHQFVKYNSPVCRLFSPPLPRLGFGCLNEEKSLNSRGLMGLVIW